MSLPSVFLSSFTHSLSNMSFLLLFFFWSLLSAFLTRFCSLSVCDAFAVCMFIVSLPFVWLLCPCPLSLLRVFPLSLLCGFSPVSPSVFGPCLSYVYLPPCLALFLFAFCLSVVCLSSFCPTVGFLCVLCSHSHVSISVAHLFSCLFLPSLFPSSYLIHCAI